MRGIDKDCGCKGCSYALRLAAERGKPQVSRKEKKEKPIPAKIVQVTRKVYISNETRDKLMFNAGRYAAGATDKVATEAYEQLERELAKK